jgi:hypothetical protein
VSLLEKRSSLLNVRGYDRISALCRRGKLPKKEKKTIDDLLQKYKLIEIGASILQHEAL